MSLKYRDSQGTETPVAGLNGTSGELVPSVSLYQSGTIMMPEDIAVNAFASYIVTFTTPMPDTDYVATVDFSNSAGHRTYGLISCMNKTVNGFTIFIRNIDTAELPITADTIVWQAFKLMTDTVHEADAAHIAQNTANFAPTFSDTTSYAVGAYVTYNSVLYRCTTAHTAGTWVAGHFTAVTVGGDLRGAYNRLKPKVWTTSINIGTSTWNVSISRSVDMVCVKLRCAVAGTATSGANVLFPNAPDWCKVKDMVSSVTTNPIAILDLQTNNSITYWNGELAVNAEWNGTGLAYDAEV